MGVSGDGAVGEVETKRLRREERESLGEVGEGEGYVLRDIDAGDEVVKVE